MLWFSKRVGMYQYFMKSTLCASLYLKGVASHYKHVYFKQLVKQKILEQWKIFSAFPFVSIEMLLV